jgi:hypothetical protein
MEHEMAWIRFLAVLAVLSPVALMLWGVFLR